MALREFLAVIKDRDVARSNAFVVEIWPPKGSGLAPDQSINLMCQDVTFPGQNIRTSTDDLRQGPTREIANAVTYGNCNMTFICTPGMVEKLFFEAWQKLMFNHITWQAKFYKNYIGQIKLRSLDRTTVVRYGIVLHEAYPKIINAQDYSNTNQDQMQTLQVEFNFHHWTRDDEVYRPTPLWGSEHGEADKIPRRKGNPDLTQMTMAQAQAYLRGETVKVLNGEGVAVDVTLEGTLNKAPLGLGSVIKTMLAPAVAYAGTVSIGVGNKAGSNGVIPAPVHPANSEGEPSSVLMSAMTGGFAGGSFSDQVSKMNANAVKYEGAIASKGAKEEPAPGTAPNRDTGGVEEAPAARTYSVNSRTGETNPWPDPIPDPNGPKTPAEAWAALQGVLGPLKQGSTAAGGSPIQLMINDALQPTNGQSGPHKTAPVTLKTLMKYQGAVASKLSGGLIEMADAGGPFGFGGGSGPSEATSRPGAGGPFGALISNAGGVRAATQLTSGISVAKFSFTASLGGKGISLRSVGTVLSSKGGSSHWSGKGGAGAGGAEGGASGDGRDDR